MKEFGISEMIYPYIDNAVIVQLTFAVIITALLASIYPAYKAVRLKPVEAVRKV